MTLLQSCEQDGEKRAAAARAVEEAEDGMVLGLGSGSTAAFAVEALAARIVLREKIVESASDRMIVVVDETKLVDRLGRSTPLPVETVSFGSQTTLDRLLAFGCEPRLRMVGDKPFTTDSGNYIIDCIIAEIPDPTALEARLSALVGVVESGLFVGLASKIVVGRPAGVEIIER
jgi:ribose 5-phosphate isomerase A